MAQPTRVIVLQRPDQPLETLCTRLSEWGCELASCDSYERAAAALAAEGADIVLIDAWVQDGMPLLTRVKASRATRYLPIVIATADEPAAVAAHAMALGADDVFVLPIGDAELQARTRALARLAAIEIERRRRDALLAQFGVARTPETPGVPAIDRIGVLLIGPAGGDQIQVLTALGRGRHRGLRRDCGCRDRAPAPRRSRRRPDHHQPRPPRAAAPVRRDPQRCRAVRSAGRAGRTYPPFCGPRQALRLGRLGRAVSAFHPEVLRLRVQAWVRQQRLRRHLRSCLVGLAPTTDRLTRLYGHGFLHAYVNDLIEQAARTGNSLAVVSVSVTRMGQINQLYGYAAGDRVLATLGAALARYSRAEDLPARLDGDRFVW